MTITSKGYDGSMNEVAWATMADMVGGPWGSFDNYQSFQVLVGGAGARAVTVKAGTAFMDGVTVTSDADIVVNAGALSSGTVRWDTVVLRRIWGSNSSSVVILAGTSAQSATRGTISPGSQNDQLLALIKITSSADVQQVIDLRVNERKYAEGWGDPDAIQLQPYYNSRYYNQATQEWWHMDQTDPITGGGLWVNKTKPTPIALPLAGGGLLVPFNVGPSYRKVNGRVKWNGTVKRANGTMLSAAGNNTDVIINTAVPVGYRPGQQCTFVLPELGGVDFCRATLSPAGVLSVIADGKDIFAVALDGIDYIAEGA